MPIRLLVAVSTAVIIAPGPAVAGEESIDQVTEETRPQPKHSMFRLQVGESTVVTGRVLRVESNEVECWCLLWDGGRFELAGLPEALQRDGLRIRATVHVESDRTGVCAPGLVLIVDDVSVE